MISLADIMATAVAAPPVWKRCGVEGGTCTVPSPRVVRYGANGEYAYREVAGGTVCGVASFGYDPIVGVFKSCEYESAPRAKNVVALEPVTWPGYKVRHASFLGFISPIGSYSSDAEWGTARWSVRRGLGDPACLSLESADRPGSYLRNQFGRITLSIPDGSFEFNGDATFCPRAPLAGAARRAGAVSLESKRFPGNYLIHRNFELVVAPRESNSVYAGDASFYLANPAKALSTGAVVNLEALTWPGYRVRHADFLGFISPINATSVRAVKGDSAWRVKPGLADANCVSFESINNPGQYLRHQFQRVILNVRDNSALFDQDATFCPRPPNSGQLGGQAVSFEAYNLPGQFIRHINFELFVGGNDGSDIFKTDTTFLPNGAR